MTRTNEKTRYSRRVVCDVMRCPSHLFEVSYFTKNKVTGKVHVSIRCAECGAESDIT